MISDINSKNSKPIRTGKTLSYSLICLNNSFKKALMRKSTKIEESMSALKTIDIMKGLRKIPWVVW